MGFICCWFGVVYMGKPPGEMSPEHDLKRLVDQYAPLPRNMGEADTRRNITPEMVSTFLSDAFKIFRRESDPESPEISFKKASDMIPQSVAIDQPTVQRFVNEALTAERDDMLKSFGYKPGAAEAQKMLQELRELSAQSDDEGFPDGKRDRLTRMGGAYSDFTRTAGLFVSAISARTTGDLNINVQELGIGLDYLGYGNATFRRITIDGDVGDYFGADSSAGVIMTSGTAKDYLGYRINGAVVSAEGGARDYAGELAEAGWIHSGEKLTDMNRHMGRGVIITDGPDIEIETPHHQFDLVPAVYNNLEPELLNPLICKPSDLRLGEPGVNAEESILTARRWILDDHQLCIRIATKDVNMSESVSALVRDQLGLDELTVTHEKPELTNFGSMRFYELYGRRGKPFSEEPGLTAGDMENIAKIANKILQLQK